MDKWIRRGPLIVEIFIVANLGFLALDIFIAHSTNSFSNTAEWIPFYFSIGAPILLIFELVQNRHNKQRRCHSIGYVVGAFSMLVGSAGLLWHLNSAYFEYHTLKSLVYTAPFVAPLVYTGLGCLLVMNRMVNHDEVEWSQWLIFFGLAGFFGNFVLALCDHAQNGFFSRTEWIPVISSALAVSFLGTALIRKCSHQFIKICMALMVGQVLVGVLGFYFHGVAVTRGLAASFFENLIYTAPVFAPLLFVNLAFLSVLGLAGLRHRLLQSGELA